MLFWFFQHCSSKRYKSNVNVSYFCFRRRLCGLRAEAVAGAARAAVVSAGAGGDPGQGGPVEAGGSSTGCQSWPST
jgi:hypothetical protein